MLPPAETPDPAARPEATNGGSAAAPEGGANTAPDATLDITADTCPMTFVRTRIALDRLAAGGVLAVRLRGEEPRRSVPAASRELGHAVLGEVTDAAGVTTLLIRKSGAGRGP